MKRGLFEVRTGKKGTGKAKTIRTEAARVATLALLALMALWVAPGAPAMAQTDALFVAPGGNVGIGTSTPGTLLHLLDNSAGTSVKLTLERSAAPASVWELVNRSVDGDMAINTASMPGAELILRSNGDLRILGTLTTAGSCAVGCDAIFQPSFELEPIEEHAASMWANSHLPGVGPTPEGAPMNLSEKTTGILNELEKAHIYIEQLNKSLKASKAENVELRERLARVENVLGLAGH